MARSKRPLSPLADRHGSKRLRLQSQEVIIIDDDGVNILPPTNAERMDDSDIEIIDDPLEIEALRKCKGKQKARLQAGVEMYSTNDPMDDLVHDGKTLASIMQKDEELAHRLAMEWASEPSPRPADGPSLSSVREGQASSSSSSYLSTYHDIEIIEAPPKEAFASKPSPTLEGLNPANLHVPDIKLPNPEHRLKEIKKLVTINRECPRCDTLISPPRTPATVDPRAPNECRIPSSIVALLHLQCPNEQCGAAYCRGCFRSVGCFPKCSQAGTLIICEAAECCPDARAIALYEALSAFDSEYLADKASAETRAMEMKKQSKASKVKTVGPGGTGYSQEGGSIFDEWDDDQLEEDGLYISDDDDDDDVLHLLDDDLAGSIAQLESRIKQIKNQVAQLPILPSLQSVVGSSAGGPKKTSGAGKGKTKGGPTFPLGGLGRGSSPVFHTNGGASPKHLGRGASRRGPSRRKEKQEATETGEVTTDQRIINAFQLLTELLPACYSDQPAVYDLLPHPAVGALILTSYVPTVLAQLLRNDSVVDWIARSSLYHAMLTLLKRMADCELTIPILVGHRPQFSSPGLAARMWNQGQLEWQREEGGEVEMALPLLEHFKKLKKQAETFLQTTKAQFSDNEEDPAFVEGWSLCSDIVSAQDNIKRAMSALQRFSVNRNIDVQASFGAAPGSMASTSGYAGPVTRSSTRESNGKGKAVEPVTQPSAHDMEKEYSLACETLSFEYVSLANPDTKNKSSSGLVYSGYKFADELKQTQNATRHPKDRIRFAKELAVTATSLPPGIWVRVDDVRNDAIKVMIAGPQGTPYAGGLFEFDCFIPLEYPRKPPVMHLRTTGRGTVRFNPNLYNDGKVCLSLLGTWEGTPEERWTAKSTLLQVLVSIQSMILNEAPYFNEPGHGRANLTHPASISYNRDRALQTVRWAMVDWFKEEHRNGVWKNVIKSHFTLRKDQIRKQITAWAQDDRRMNDYHASLRMPEMLGMPVVSSVYKGFSGLRLPPPPAPSQTPGMDLVAEFDAGMRQVEAWPSEG